jgi:hypothetical protein
VGIGLDAATIVPEAHPCMGVGRIARLLIEYQ